MLFFRSIKSLLRTELLVLRSVFQLLGPLGILCRLAGQFPVSASLTGDTLLLQYHFFSTPSFYNLFMTNLPCVIYLYKRIDRISSANLYTLYSNSFRLIQILVQLITAKGWSDVLGLVGELETFDSKLHQLPVLVNRNPATKSYKLVWITIPFLQFLNIFSLEVLYGWKNRFYYSIRPTCTLPLMLQTILFFFFLTGLIVRTKHFQQSWILYLKVAARHNYSSRSLRLDLYRSLHTKLTHCFSLLNSAFAFTLFAAVSLLFLDLITEPYHAYKSGHFGHRFSDRLWCLVLIVFIAVYTARLDQVANIVLNEIFDIRLTGLNKCMRSHTFYQVVAKWIGHQNRTPGSNIRRSKPLTCLNHSDQIYYPSAHTLNLLISSLHRQWDCEDGKSKLDLLVYQLARSKPQIEVPGLVVFSRDFFGSFVTISVTYFILSAQISAQFFD